MGSNILALPLAHLTIITGNNEDWIDTVQVIGQDDKPVDLRGIEFDMNIRRRVEAYEVVLRASTDNRWLYVGTPPHVSFFIIAIPERIMRGHFAGEYVGDVRARADGFYRRFLTMDLLIVEGITKSFSAIEGRYQLLTGT